MTTQNNTEASPAQNDGPCPTCGSIILLGRMRHHKTWCHGQATPEPCSALPAVTVEPLRKPFVPVLDLTVVADNDEHRAQISADGRGDLMSSYDGEENEERVQTEDIDETLYIYRVN